MKAHNGMRPLDILILLHLSILKDENWKAKDFANKLNISASEVSESLNRSAIGGLLSKDKRTVMKSSLLEFLEFGLKYVFPQKPGSIVRGVPTAHSAPPLNKVLHSEDNYVWQYPTGKSRGQEIIPLYKSVPAISLEDNNLYELLALTDALRIGKVREQKLAIKELRKRIIEF